MQKDDVIYRQAAIDALERKKDKTAKGEIGSFYNTIIQHDIDTIEQLPPTQQDASYEQGKIEGRVEMRTEILCAEKSSGERGVEQYMSGQSDLIRREDVKEKILRHKKILMDRYGVYCSEHVAGVKDGLQFAIGHIQETPPSEPTIIHCRDCKYYIPYEWMFDGLTRSSNIKDYSADEIGCSVNDHNYPPDGFCSCGERKENR